jgi:hypothetical protein
MVRGESHLPLAPTQLTPESVCYQRDSVSDNFVRSHHHYGDDCATACTAAHRLKSRGPSHDWPSVIVPGVTAIAETRFRCEYGLTADKMTGMLYEGCCGEIHYPIRFDNDQ